MASLLVARATLADVLVRQVRKSSQDVRAVRHGDGLMATHIEREHMGRVKELPCSVCGAPPPSIAHHILEDRIPGRKSPDLLTIPLCESCHVDPHNGVHHMRAMWKVMKKNELGCLADTIERLFYRD